MMIGRLPLGRSSQANSRNTTPVARARTRVSIASESKSKGTREDGIGSSASCLTV